MEEREEQQRLVGALGDALDEYVIAKVQRDRAIARYDKAQRAVSDKEDRIRQFMWGEREGAPVKN